MKAVMVEVYSRFDNSPMFKWPWSIVDLAIIAIALTHHLA